MAIFRSKLSDPGAGQDQADITNRQYPLESLGFPAGVKFYSNSTPTLDPLPDCPSSDDCLLLLLLLLADDMTLCTGPPAELQQALRALRVVCERWGLRLNPTKTKIMYAGPGEDNTTISLSNDSVPLEVATSFRFLGSWFSQMTPPLTRSSRSDLVLPAVPWTV